MGVLEYFGTLLRNGVTSSAIKSDYKQKTVVHHLLLDFNSIIHVASQGVLSELKTFLSNILKTSYQKRAFDGEYMTEQFDKYKMRDFQKEITKDMAPEKIIKLFQKYFNVEYLDKLIIVTTINALLHIIRTYCENNSIKTIMIAIDGVPSKGKLMEQKQRRFVGAISEQYAKKIRNQYKDYLLKQENYAYLSTGHNIKWTRNKIMPGTAFMRKLSAYLRCDEVQKKLKTNRGQVSIIISDMHEIGEGEKKVVNYINKYHKNSDEKFVIYSPDADMVLLSILLPIKNICVLKYNQQQFFYDMIDIDMLKNNIAMYINNNPISPKSDFDTTRINHDLVFISNLFGNDFVPKIETFNVKKGFQNIMDAYLRVLVKMKNKSSGKCEYLVTIGKSKRGLNYPFLINVLKYILREEDDFIDHNELYARYKDAGQIKNVFDHIEISADNIETVVDNFRKDYGELKNLINQNRNTREYESDEQFMKSLRKAISITLDGQIVNTVTLTNREVIGLLSKVNEKTKKFPNLMISTYSHSYSINDQYHKNATKDKNDYEKELYKFEKMLDEYRKKFHAFPLNLKRPNIEKYYRDYFGTELYNGEHLSKEANEIMHDYTEGLLWVLEYYFNDPTYLNTWVYKHERAPLIKHLLIYLEGIDQKILDRMQDKLVDYRVSDIMTFFNPVEQIIYVSPMTEEIVGLLPEPYQKYLKSDNLDPFIRNYIIDTNDIVERLWNEKSSSDIDCQGVIFFNKCLMKQFVKLTHAEDKIFMGFLRKIKQDDISKRRSFRCLPPY